jgi:ferredoxin--NADP+ reductase
MERPGSADHPLRVAVIGSGPAGFYTAQHLLQTPDLTAGIDMFERLPAPFGLVRYGVAPDHEKIRSAIGVYHRLALHPRFRFFGNVEYGRDLSRADLEGHYHQIVFCTGAQADRRLGIPGEDLVGCHSATEFVAWYNGHPDSAGRRFDLSCRRAVVVGVGNVAVDVARILCRSPAELATTDIADPALEALSASAVREVSLLGRRGPLQAAFTSAEIKELGQMADASVSTLAEEVEPDELSRRALAASADRGATRKLEILRAYAGRPAPGKSRHLRIRFLVSPAEILGDGRGRVRAVRLVRNELFADESGEIRCRPTRPCDTLEAGLVLRSVGYRGVALPGLPFDARAGVVPNDGGRIVEPPDGRALAGFYASGWIKRGPSGVIGTNKPDAAETVGRMLADLSGGRHLDPPAPQPESVEVLLRRRGVRFLSYADWQRIDALEVERGARQGRPRVRLLQREAFLAALATDRGGQPGGQSIPS